jgi:hypothetical protein
LQSDVSRESIMIRKTCSFILKLDSHDERHRRYCRDARTLSNVRGNLKCWSFFPGTLRNIADKTQIPTLSAHRVACSNPRREVTMGFNRNSRINVQYSS